MAELSGLLAHTLGQEKSTEVVEATATRLGLRGPFFEHHEAEAVLEHLAKTGGLVGIAARFAQRRGLRTDDAAPPSSARPREPASARATVVELLSAAIGADKAEEAIMAASRTLGFGATLTEGQAIAILEELASAPGPIATTARFAKARFLLRR